MSVGEQGFNAGDSNTLNVDQPFEPPQARMPYIMIITSTLQTFKMPGLATAVSIHPTIREMLFRIFRTAATVHPIPAIPEVRVVHAAAAEEEIELNIYRDRFAIRIKCYSKLILEIFYLLIGLFQNVMLSVEDDQGVIKSAFDRLKPLYSNTSFMAFVTNLFFVTKITPEY